MPLLHFQIEYRSIPCRVAGVSDSALGWAYCLTLDLGLDVFFDMCFSCAVRVCCCTAIFDFHSRLALKPIFASIYVPYFFTYVP